MIWFPPNMAASGKPHCWIYGNQIPLRGQRTWNLTRFPFSSSTCDGCSQCSFDSKNLTFNWCVSLQCLWLSQIQWKIQLERCLQRRLDDRDNALGNIGKMEVFLSFHCCPPNIACFQHFQHVVKWDECKLIWKKEPWITTSQKWYHWCANHIHFVVCTACPHDDTQSFISFGVVNNRSIPCFCDTFDDILIRFGVLLLCVFDWIFDCVTPKWSRDGFTHICISSNFWFTDWCARCILEQIKLIVFGMNTNNFSLTLLSHPWKPRDLVVSILRHWHWQDLSSLIWQLWKMHATFTGKWTQMTKLSKFETWLAVSGSMRIVVCIDGWATKEVVVIWFHLFKHQLIQKILIVWEMVQLAHFLLLNEKIQNQIFVGKPDTTIWTICQSQINQFAIMVMQVSEFTVHRQFQGTFAFGCLFLCSCDQMLSVSLSFCCMHQTQSVLLKCNCQSLCKFVILPHFFATDSMTQHCWLKFPNLSTTQWDEHEDLFDLVPRLHPRKPAVFQKDQVCHVHGCLQDPNQWLPPKRCSECVQNSMRWFEETEFEVLLGVCFSFSSLCHSDHQHWLVHHSCPLVNDRQRKRCSHHLEWPSKKFCRDQTCAEVILWAVWRVWQLCLCVAAICWLNQLSKSKHCFHHFRLASPLLAHSLLFENQMNWLFRAHSSQIDFGWFEDLNYAKFSSLQLHWKVSKQRAAFENAVKKCWKCAKWNPLKWTCCHCCLSCWYGSHAIHLFWMEIEANMIRQNCRQWNLVQNHMTFLKPLVRRIPGIALDEQLYWNCMRSLRHQKHPSLCHQEKMEKNFLNLQCLLCHPIQLLLSCRRELARSSPFHAAFAECPNPPKKGCFWWATQSQESFSLVEFPFCALLSLFAFLSCHQTKGTWRCSWDESPKCVQWVSFLQFCASELCNNQACLARTRWNPPFPMEQPLNDDETTVKMDSFLHYKARIKLYV